MARIFLSPPDVGPAERDALLQAFDSGWIAPVGPALDGFEADITKVTNWDGAVALGSGSAALHLALLVHGVKPGDDVFVSTFTFAATANAVKYCGANPVFIDSEASSWNMSPALLRDALADAEHRGNLPSAVVVVDLYGQCADYDAIVPQCRALGVPVIEDAAESLLSRYKNQPSGTLGDCGIFSFNGNKIMTTSGGGMFVSPDRETADRVRYLATQARQPVTHYEHTEIGFNYRQSNLLAAIGRAQLGRLPEMSAKRREINNRYRQQLSSLSEIEFMPIPSWSEWNGWLTCLTFELSATRDAVIDALAAADIESRPLWKPLHLQPVFADCQTFCDGTSEQLFDRGVCVPSGSSLTFDQVDDICERIRSAVRGRPHDH